MNYDDATKVDGRYIVTDYIVAKDTLYRWPSTRKINKLGIEAFAITVDRTGENQVQISTSYYRNGAHPTQVKTATVSPEPYEYTISLKNDSLTTGYDGRVVRKIFYQKQTSGGLYIPVTLSGAPVVQTTPQEVTIIAQLQ